MCGLDGLYVKTNRFHNPLNDIYFSFYILLHFFYLIAFNEASSGGLTTSCSSVAQCPDETATPDTGQASDNNEASTGSSSGKVSEILTGFFFMQEYLKICYIIASRIEYV